MAQGGPGGPVRQDLSRLDLGGRRFEMTTTVAKPSCRHPVTARHVRALFRTQPANIGLLETALRAPPWQRMYTLSGDELRRMRVAILESEDDVPLVTTDPPAC